MRFLLFLLENNGLLVVILLFGFPFSGAIVGAALPLWLLRRSRRAVLLWLALPLSVAGYALGSVAGLLLALQVNRWVFHWRVLADAIGPDSPAVVGGVVTTLLWSWALLPAMWGLLCGYRRLRCA